MDTKFSFKAFLSHKYEFPEVNLYFFQLFNEVAAVQFELDAKKGATNVTRLERMIRDSDAFIGIYPFLGVLEEANRKQQLQSQSKYFRLEMELAIRSQRPAIIFYDKRYGEILKPPPGIFSYSFDVDEIVGKGEFPNREFHKDVFLKFHELIKLNKGYNNGIYKEKSKIGLFIPPDDHSNICYSPGCVERIKTLIEDKAVFEVVVINKIPVIDLKFLRFIDKLDFVVVDLSEPIMKSGIPAYLHGKFIPMIRLNFQNENTEKINPPLSDSFLFGGVEAGYPKDIICWNTIDFLCEKLNDRLTRIYEASRLIKENHEAIDYFRSAAIVDKKVFLSFAGEDEEKASLLYKALKKRFKVVFNYKDNESIPGGESWKNVIYESISSSDVAIPLLSKSYFDSPQCKHEFEHMTTEVENGLKIMVYPLKLYPKAEGDDFEMPKDVMLTQYKKSYMFESDDAIVEDIMRRLKEKEMEPDKKP